MDAGQEKKEYDRKRFVRLYNISLSYLMIFVLAAGLFIGMLLAFFFLNPVTLYLYIAIASLIIMMPSLIGFVRAYLLAKREIKFMHTNGGQKN